MLKCYYTFDKLTAMRKNMALTVYYENENIINRYWRTFNVNQHKPFHERDQSEFEISCAKEKTRVFSSYTYFFNKYISLDALLQYIISDDDVLKKDNAQAQVFYNAAMQSIDACYGLENANKVFLKKKQLTLTL